MAITRLGLSGFSRFPYGDFTGKTESAVATVAISYNELAMDNHSRALVMLDDCRGLAMDKHERNNKLDDV